MSDVFAAEVAAHEKNPATIVQAPSAETLRNEIDGLLAELPGILDVTVREYFTGCAIERGSLEDVLITSPEVGGLTLHELLYRCVREASGETDFAQVVETLSEVDRKPRNHIDLLVCLYAVATYEI